MKPKLKQFDVFKIETTRFVEKQNNKIKIKPLTLTKREAIENGEMVKIQNNQLVNQLVNHLSINKTTDLTEYIVNIVVPTERKKSGEREYAELAKAGFELNGNHYVRISSGSGQIRRNTITFIRDDLYEPIFNSLLCGLTVDDFGNDFNAAKFNAYLGLNMSGCHLLPDSIAPSVCIVDDYEAIRPHNTVNYVTEKKVNYITLSDDDYILSEDDENFTIAEGKAVRNSDGTQFDIHSGIKKYIEAKPYDEIDGSPALNSFDGQGLMSPEFAGNISKQLGLGYLPSEVIVRAPWVKGLLVTVPFKEWFVAHNITEITDSFGKVRKIEELDCIISKSQFKMHKIYKKKCAALGVNAWDYHCQAMRENGLHWGITRTSRKTEVTEKTLNYQYLQALQLENEDVDDLCKATEDFLSRLNSGNIYEVYNSLIVSGKYFDDYEDEEENEDYKKLFQKVIEANPNFINDKHIRELIFKECETKLNAAKLGKILVCGNFQFCVSDPLAQTEWVAKNHCNYDIDVNGIVPAGCVYSNYWDAPEVVLMRSPLIDRNEIAKRTVLTDYEDYFRYLNSGIVYSIHDLTALQQGGCDFDGDIIFSTTNPIIAKGCYDFATAKPLYYSLATTDLVGNITKAKIIAADVRGLNSAVGQISNRGGSLYAMLENYAPESTEYAKIYDSIVALGQVVGMEIDRIKTAVAPTFPLEWKTVQSKRLQDDEGNTIVVSSEEEQAGTYRHNDLVPNVKPYYMRYNYSYLDDEIKALYKCFNQASVPLFGKKWSEVCALCEAGKGTEKMMQLFEQYNDAYPVIDTDCIVNHISHRFEDFSLTLKNKTISEGEKMLGGYTSIRDEFNSDNLSKAREIVNAYHRFKRFILKTHKYNEKSNKEKCKQSGDMLKEVRNYYFEELMNLFSNDLQAVFDYLIAVANGKEYIVWDILDTNIVKIIAAKKGQMNVDF